MADFVKNNVVHMDWRVEDFIQSRKQGFIGALKEYEINRDIKPYGHVDTIMIGFCNGFAFMLFNEDNQIAGREDFMAEYKQLAKEPDASFPSLLEGVNIIYDGKTFEDEIAKYFGLDQYKDDIIARITDLDPYDEIDFKPMQEMN